MVKNEIERSPQRVLHDAIQNVAVGPDRGRDISAHDAQIICSALLDQELDELQAAVLLIAMRMKRESSDELSGLFQGLISHCQLHQVQRQQLLCLADPFDGYLRYNSITAFVAPTLAACGVAAVMHGVHSVGPKHGITAHQLYQLADIATSVSVQQAARNVEKYGWAYVDQASYAPKLFNLRGIRDRMVKRTALTTLERVLMPLRAQQQTHLVLGYVHKAYPEVYLNLAKQAGYHSATLVKGVEGGFAPALNKPLRRYHQSCLHEVGSDIEKQLLDIPSNLTGRTTAAENNQPVTAQNCYDQGRAVLEGQHGIARDSLCLTVANILHAHNHANSLAEAVEKVQDCLDNGSALACFTALREPA